MEVTIDKAGRIVVPKPLRDKLGLQSNSRLELEETSEGIFLKPAGRGSGLVRDEHGWLVHTGRPVGKIDWERLIEEDREEQIRKTGGW